MIDKLEMFIALANERHFGRAAEAMGVTQPSLSGAIRQLEDQLGVQLVFRGSRFQGLTPEGQRVLDWARRIVGDMRALKDEMRSVHAGLSGNLRIGVIPTALPMVADLTVPFTARHPKMRVTILSRTSAEILDGIDSLTLDAGITYLDNEPLGRVAQTPLYAEFYRYLCAPTSPLARQARVTWAEVALGPLCLSSTSIWPKPVRGWCRRWKAIRPSRCCRMCDRGFGHRLCRCVWLKCSQVRGWSPSRLSSQKPSIWWA
jgi:DNA-binding transcriptional LysR family regulator